jgi:hypothetical protein
VAAAPQAHSHARVRTRYLHIICVNYGFGWWSHWWTTFLRRVISYSYSFAPRPCFHPSALAVVNLGFIEGLLREFSVQGCFLFREPEKESLMHDSPYAQSNRCAMRRLLAILLFLEGQAARRVTLNENENEA